MGTTDLFVVRSDKPGKVEVYFKGRRGGAHGWQFIVDGFDAAARSVEADEPGAVLRSEPHRSLGRGARISGSPTTILKIVRRWTTLEAVQAALQTGSLSIRRSLAVGSC